MAVSWSGGKDSALALEEIRNTGEREVAALVTTVTDVYDRISIHGVRRSLLRTQAERIGLPLVEVVIPPGASNEVYEARMADTLGRLRDRIHAVVFGDLFLEDIRAYRERQMAALGLEPLFPLWGKNTDVLARVCLARGHRATIVAVDAQQLDPSFAGRKYDAMLLQDLPEGVDACGERGEFHTFVHEGPVLSAPIAVRVGDVVTRDDRWVFADLLEGDA